MPAEFVSLPDLGEREIQAWQELGSRAAEPNPYLLPQFVLPAARMLDPADLSLLLAWEDGELIACLPVRRRRWWRRTPLTGLIGWRHLYSFLGTPLLDADRLEPGLSAILDRLDADPESAFMAIELMGADGRVLEALTGLLRERGRAPVEAQRFERAALRRRPDGSYLDASHKHRREWKRQRRRLEEALGAEVRAADRSDDPGAVEDFLRIEASGWKGERGTAFLRLPGHAAFFREVCSGFRARGRLQLLALEADGRPLALKCNLATSEGIFCFKIGFDASLARFSPGIQLELDNVTFFHEQTNAPWMDSCAAADHPMINRLWPDRRSIVALVIPAGGARGRLARRGIGAAAALRNRTLSRRT